MWELWATCQATQSRGPALRGGASRTFGFEGQHSLIAGAPQDWRKQRLHYCGCIQVSHDQVPGQRHWLHRSLGQTFLLVLEGLLGRWGAAVANPGDVDNGGRDTGECSSVWTLLEAYILLGSLAPTPGHSQQSVGSSAGTSQTKPLTGWEHSPTH